MRKTQVWDPGALLSARLLTWWVLRKERVPGGYSYVRAYVYHIGTRLWVRGEIESTHLSSCFYCDQNILLLYSVRFFSNVFETIPKNSITEKPCRFVKTKMLPSNSVGRGGGWKSTVMYFWLKVVFFKLVLMHLSTLQFIFWLSNEKIASLPCNVSNRCLLTTMFQIYHICSRHFKWCFS